MFLTIVYRKIFELKTWNWRYFFNYSSLEILDYRIWIFFWCVFSSKIIFSKFQLWNLRARLKSIETFPKLLKLFNLRTFKFFGIDIPFYNLKLNSICLRSRFQQDYNKSLSKLGKKLGYSLIHLEGSKGEISRGKVGFFEEASNGSKVPEENLLSSRRMINSVRKRDAVSTQDDGDFKRQVRLLWSA